MPDRVLRADQIQTDVDVLKEEPLQFGESGRSLGILTLPSIRLRQEKELPVFVFLNAGLLHRVGPRRLYVRLARGLSQMGFASLRVDLAGTGDSPVRSGLTNRQSVAADFEEIASILESRLGRVPLVLAGLCSGADNAIMLTLEEPRVVGMVLLDPICFRDDGFRTRALIRKAFDRATHPVRTISGFRRRVKNVLQGKERRSVDPLSLRDLPSREQMRQAFDLIRERNGRVLSVFTHYALQYYNQGRQLDRVLSVEGYQDFCTELFWPDAEHTYLLEVHRLRLMETIKNWSTRWGPISSQHANTRYCDGHCKSRSV